MSFWRPLGAILLLASLAALLPRLLVQAADPPLPEPGGKTIRLEGVASCATANCHHQNGPRGSERSEYSTWLLHDPHARAYQVLLEPRSRRMIENLKEKVPAEQNQLCLQCHAMDETKARVEGRVLRRDGVGCESCHGAAEHWLHEHYKTPRAEWKDKRGFIDLTDLTVRAQTCAECHIGHDNKDVNHDLIAAGHPWMRFEYGSFLANYPRHWSERKDKQGRPDFEARAWMLGQLVSAESALRLLKFRAEHAEKPWPEFAESSCFACHHDLTDQKWRRAPEHVHGRLGAIPWNDWYVSLIDVLETERPAQASTLPLAELQALQKLMGRPLPDRVSVADAANEAAVKLGLALRRWEKVTLDEAQVERWLRALDAKAAKDQRHQNWDEAAQLYLALSALQQAQEEMRPGAISKSRQSVIESLRRSLAFPPGFDSPSDSPPRSPRPLR